MKNEYPTEKELKEITNWDITKQDIRLLLEYIEDIWWCPDFGFKLSGKRILNLELNTGGWSGNEDIIIALKKNFLFWSMFWEKSIKGGHYYFRIDLKIFKRRKNEKTKV